MSETKADLSRVTSFVDILNARATEQSDQPSYVFLSAGEEVDTLTFAQLQRKARAVGAHLQEMNAQNERVLLLYPSGLDYVVALYACFYGRAIAVPAYPPRMNQNLRRFTANNCADYLSHLLQASKPVRSGPQFESYTVGDNGRG
jgi:acyl-CoA synthetase (AMP-forming)/AMP-acid ligase II